MIPDAWEDSTAPLALRIQFCPIAPEIDADSLLQLGAALLMDAEGPTPPLDEAALIQKHKTTSC